jgi:hypothetical protein
MFAIMNQIGTRMPPHKLLAIRVGKSRCISTTIPSKLTSYPTSIRPSKQEMQDARLSPRNLEIAIRSLYQDGLVVVEDAVPHAVLDRLNEKMVHDAFTLQERKADSPYNYNPGNIQQDAPPMKKYFDSKIFMSELVTINIKETIC